MLTDGSSIVYVSSVGSTRVVPMYGAIGTAKAAGDAIVRYLAVELAPRGIRVNAVSPGLFASKAAGQVVGDVEVRLKATDKATPRGRRIELEEMANAIAFLASPQASGITGQVLTVDGGAFSRWSVLG
jgi:enoyl-[acyl-carrier-protein] reductase (NADH)